MAVVGMPRPSTMHSTAVSASMASRPQSAPICTRITDSDCPSPVRLMMPTTMPAAPATRISGIRMLPLPKTNSLHSARLRRRLRTSASPSSITDAPMAEYCAPKPSKNSR